MEKFYSSSPRKIWKNKEELEKKLNIRLKVQGKQVEINGSTIEEYEAKMILEALDFGFKLKDALRLTDENVAFRKLPIKRFTRRKDLEEVRGRVIGTYGKTKHAVEEVSGCAIVVHESQVGIIGPAENIEEATTALINLIKGSKQANVYRFLEKMNTSKKEKPVFKKKTKEEYREEEQSELEEDEDADNE